MLIRKYMNKATRGMIEAEMKQNFFTIKSKKQVASAATENLTQGGWMEVNVEFLKHSYTTKATE